MNLSDIKGVGPVAIRDLGALGIVTVEDLLGNYPRRYEDYSEVTPINKLAIGKVSLRAKITSVSARYARRGMHITDALASDGTGSVKLVWFNQSFRKNSIKLGHEYYVSGNYDLKRSQFTITSPNIELVSDMPVNTARILPVYRETKTLKSTRIRKLYAEIFAKLHERDVIDWLPNDVKLAADMPSRFMALKGIHVPATKNDYVAARRRFTFEELFIAMFASALNKQELKLYSAPKIDYNPDDTALIKRLTDVLEFELTADQRKVAWQVLQDIQSEAPMNRIVEGDVGSGKTMVALIAALVALRHGYQVAVMSPTEILAKQHFKTFGKYFEKLGFKDDVQLLVGSMKEKEKAVVRDAFADSKPGILVGTHALISSKMSFANLGLVVVDEQHRFGVGQRKSLQKDTGLTPHFLSMTATPIPRSLALTIFGELDISVLYEKPGGRKPTITKLVAWDERTAITNMIKSEITKGHQAFVVCPAIDQNARSGMRSVSEVSAIYASLLPDARIAVLHGRMKQEEREAAMNGFAYGEIDLLVSTTVIEVGIDFPNASVMVIESAERFGLAQIHQLRGRVGRGEYQGYCYLIPTDKDANTYRLEQVSYTADGFKLAEFDLSLRGPGAVYGSLQHGALDFRLVDITDVKTIEQVSKLAKNYAGKLDVSAYPRFADKVKQFQIYTTLN